MSDPSTTGVSAARTSTDTGTAFQIVRDFLDAAVRGDAAVVDELLSPNPVSIETSGRGTERENLLRRVYLVGRLARDRHDLDHYVDIDNLTMVPAHGPGAADGLMPGDLLITVPIRPAGRRPFSQLGESWALGSGGLLIRESENLVLGF